MHEKDYSDVIPIKDRLSQEEVAKQLGLSRAKVDVIEKKALRKLRYLIKEKGYTKEDIL